MGEIAATTICQGLSFLPAVTPISTRKQLSRRVAGQDRSLEPLLAGVDPGERDEEEEGN